MKSECYDQMDDLTLAASFSTTFEALRFMSKNTMDLVLFFDIQIDETRNYKFIKAIPCRTFVIFISEFSSTAIRAYKPDVAISSKSVQFQKGVDMARIFSRLVKKENSNSSGDYFVI